MCFLQYEKIHKLYNYSVATNVQNRVNTEFDPLNY